MLAAYEWENIADVSREQLQRQLANWGRFGKLRAEQYSTDGKLYVEQRDFLGRATLNHYAKQVKAFLAWLLDTKRTTVNPMMGYEMLAGDADTRRERRAYTNEELSRLRTATLASTRKTKMGHADRWLLYNFALVTGIRQGEIHSLTVASLDLDGDVPSVRVSADDSKTKRTAHVAVGRELATDLRAFVAGRLPDCKLFPTMPTRASIPPTLRRDLEDAGIPYQDDAGRYADFHSFRHTCGTRMARGGVALVQTQEHMRHA